jgi:hypothetical protein
MSLTLLAPALAGPAASQLAQRRTRVPGLETLLTSAGIEQSAESLEHYAARLLGIGDEAPPPIAALRLAAEKAAPAPAGDDWLCADPLRQRC